jgi:hypothetical protein
LLQERASIHLYLCPQFSIAHNYCEKS